MSAVNAQVGLVARLPRALQWALLAALGLALFMAWVQYLEPQMEALDRKAAAIERQVADVRAGRTMVEKLNQRSIHEVVVGLGPVRVPLPEAQGAQAFNAAVNTILDKHGASNRSFSARSRGKLARTAMVSVAGGRRIDRLSGELKFDATPSAAMAIIADLESNPDIESVSTVRLMRDTDGRVKVHLTVETWVQTAETPKAGVA